MDLRESGQRPNQNHKKQLNRKKERKRERYPNQDQEEGIASNEEQHQDVAAEGPTYIGSSFEQQKRDQDGNE